jgi:hypothetical protein
MSKNLPKASGYKVGKTITDSDGYVHVCTLQSNGKVHYWKNTKQKRGGGRQSKEQGHHKEQEKPKTTKTTKPKTTKPKTTKPPVTRSKRHTTNESVSTHSSSSQMSIDTASTPNTQSTSVTSNVYNPIFKAIYKPPTSTPFYLNAQQRNFLQNVAELERTENDGDVKMD